MSNKYVEVMIVPGDKKNVELPSGATVADAIAAAGFDSSGYQVAVSDDPKAKLATNINNGARVVLTRQVKGAS